METGGGGRTGSGQDGRVAAHVSAPAHHLQPVETSRLQDGEDAAVCSWTHLLQAHQLPCSLNTEHDRHQRFCSAGPSVQKGPPAHLSSGTGRRLRDAVEGQVVDVHVSV